MSNESTEMTDKQRWYIGILAADGQKGKLMEKKDYYDIMDVFSCFLVDVA